MQQLVALGYAPEEAQGLPADLADVIVECGIQRPSGPLPAEWLATAVAAAEEEEEAEAEAEEEYVRLFPAAARRRPSSSSWQSGRDRDRGGASSLPTGRRARRQVVPAAAEQRRSRRRVARAAYDDDDEEDDVDDDDMLGGEEGLDAEERAYRRGLQAPVYRRGLDGEGEDDFGPTFTEQEPGLLPLLLEQVTAQIRASPVLRPLLREARFKSLLSKEADLRCVPAAASAAAAAAAAWLS